MAVPRDGQDPEYWMLAMMTALEEPRIDEPFSCCCDGVVFVNVERLSDTKAVILQTGEEEIGCSGGKGLLL